MKRMVVAACCFLTIGCGEKKEVAPTKDPEVLKREQEKLDKMMQESGEKRLGKTK